MKDASEEKQNDKQQENGARVHTGMGKGVTQLEIGGLNDEL